MVSVHNTHEVLKGSMKVEKKWRYQINLYFEEGEIMFIRMDWVIFRDEKVRNTIILL
jgi:hypothetical protein